MKRSLGALGLFFSAACASGCPVYSDNYLPPPGCLYATDCPIGYRCAWDGFCEPAPPNGGSADGGITEGGSDASGKDAITEGGTGDGSAEGAADAPPADAGPVVFCGNPNDCAGVETCSTDGTCHAGNCISSPCINQYTCANTASGPACVHGDSKGCGADRQCVATERCIDGTCTSTTELCTDRAQCGAGKVCADGRCLTACTTDGQCAVGFLCLTALGFCGAKAESCLLTSDCGSKDEVCVDGACVPRCGVVGACGTGTGAGVCIDNGCVPATKVVAECDRQGSSAGCAAGRICLHHHCYLSCAEDAGGCGAQSSTPVCRTVTVAGTSYAVCGTTETLGSECDLSAGRPCTDGKICVDGYCR